MPTPLEPTPPADPDWIRETDALVEELRRVADLRLPLPLDRVGELFFSLANEAGPGYPRCLGLALALAFLPHDPARPGEGAVLDLVREGLDEARALETVLVDGGLS